MFVLGVFIFMLSVFIITQIGQSAFEIYTSLYDPVLIFAFIAATLSVIIATNSFKTFIKAINAVLSKKYSISAADKEKSIRLFKLLSKTVNCTVAIIVVIDLIRMLGNLSDVAYIGPNLAIVILSFFYSAFINLILINPAIHILEARYNAEEKRVISEKQVIDKLMELCYKQGISPEEILDADEIHLNKHQ